jgi:hypothetical protein
MSDPTREDEEDRDAKPSKARDADATPGLLDVDDRGDITWQWKQDESLLTEDTLGAAARVRALLDVEIDLEDVDPAPHEPLNPKGLVQGYDPYQSGLLLKKERKRKRDLRALSAWVELKKKHGGKPPV